MNMENLTLTIIELVISLVVEGVILGLIFQQITNKSEAKMQSNLKQEMNTIEQQNKFAFEQLQNEIRNAKADIVSEVKEAKQGGQQQNAEQKL